MFHFFELYRDEFAACYHQRSNVESTFSMVKRKFGDPLRSKSPTALVNETLAKLLAHNLVVLVHELFELGIAPTFGEGRADEPDDDAPAIIRFPSA
ncbi:MAG: transposase [Gemmataceae bacterium]